MSVTVTSERALELSLPAEADRFLLYNVGGGAVYYGPTSSVSSSNKTGELAAGATAELSSRTWILSASRSVVETVELTERATGLHSQDLATQKELEAATSLAPTGVAVTDTATLEAALAKEGVSIILGAGEFVVNKPLKVRSRTKLEGQGRGVTTIKLASGSNCNVIESNEYGTATVERVTIRDLTIDGNKAGNTSGSCIVLDSATTHVDNCILLNPAQDGLSHKITNEPKEVKEKAGLDSRFYRTHAVGAGRYGFTLSAHDTDIVSCQAIQCAEIGFKASSNVNHYACHSWNYASDASSSDTGFQVSTDCSYVNCVSEGASVRQVLFPEGANNVRWIGGEVFCTTGAPNVPLMEFAASSVGHQIVGPYLHDFGTSAAFVFTGSAENSYIQANIYDPGSERTAASGTPAESVTFKVFLGGTTVLGTIPGYDVTRRRTFKPFNSNTQKNTMYVSSVSNRLKWKDNSETISYVLPTFRAMRNFDPWRPEGTKAENIARTQLEFKNASVLTSGTLYVVGGLVLPADEAITEIHFYSATTPATEPTHQWACLLDTSRKILAVSTDKTTTAWGANSKQSFTGLSYTAENNDKAVYVGLLVTATAVPTLQAKESVNTFPGSNAPILGGNSNTGLTTPLSVNETVNALAAKNQVAYCTVN